jgi:hypothetical protein
MEAFKLNREKGALYMKPQRWQQVCLSLSKKIQPAVDSRQQTQTGSEIWGRDEERPESGRNTKVK